MATVVYSARALSHLERAFECLASENPDAAIAAAQAIRSAVENLAAQLYRFVVPQDEVRALASIASLASD